MGTSETPGRSPGTPDRSRERDDRTGRAAAAQRIARQHEYVDLSIKQAMERGESPRFAASSRSSTPAS
jgi:hypothetical protein